MQSEAGGVKWNANISHGRSFLNNKKGPSVRIPAIWNFNDAAVCVKKKLSNL